jgi:phosphoglycerate dehydrogenase-like enzyme
MSPVHLLVLSNPAAPYLRLLKRLPPSTVITVSNNGDYLAREAPGADVILNAFSPSDLLRVVFPLTKKLRWIHSLSAGVEKLLWPELIESPVLLTNGRGVYRRPLAEWAVGAALFFAKDFRRLVRQQESGVWEQFEVEELHGRTLSIVGYGEIGRAVAEKARAFGMEVIALRRHPEISAGEDFATMSGPSQLHDMLKVSDYLLISVPSTPATNGMISDAEFAVMKPSAVIINIGRGSVVDEAALVRALREKRIRGAALDVFEREPLVDGHPLYGLSNVLLSPHCADHAEGMRDQAMEMFIRNFEHFIKGEPLENVVDKRAGY